jgi:nucleotide-binding universal stress UspA family protein
MADYTVLIPLDGSPLAEHSLRFLPGLMQLGDVALHLLSVVDETEEIHDLTSAEVVERERNVLTTYLDQTAAGVKELHGLNAAVEAQVGVPGDVIQKRVDALRPDLLVISTHGRSGLSRWRHGSVAARLMHGATCPLLIVGPKAAEPGDWRRGETVASFDSILVPLDGSERAEQALTTAAAMAQQFGSRLHLVRAVRPRAAGDPMAAGGNADLINQMEQGAANYLEKVRARLHAGGDVVTAVRLGTAATELEEYISSEKIDLVVMTSHGRSGLVRAALGSVTDRLAGNGTAPVLVVRSPV